jgi:hypothetical protein
LAVLAMAAALEPAGSLRRTHCDGGTSVSAAPWRIATRWVSSGPVSRIRRGLPV